VIADGLLARLAALDVSAQADHGALRLRPASAIPPDLLAMLHEHKTELLAGAHLHAEIAPNESAGSPQPISANL
jgi:TubC N-terminal docking domain